MPRNARFSEWSPNLAFWTWDDLIHYLNLTTWCKQYERYLCRIWSRHGGSFTSSVSWHQKSLYDNVIIRNCATKISNHDTLVRCHMHCRNRFSDMKYQKIQAEVWQTSVSLRLNPACKIPCLTEWQGCDCDCARPPAVSRRSWTPVSVCREVLQLL